MTVPSIYVPPQYTGNGVTTAFAFPFSFFVPTELLVNLFDTTAAQDVAQLPALDGAGTFDYTVTGTQDADTGEYLSGATVTFNTAPPANYTVTIFRNVQPTQTMALTNNARFPAKTVEGAFDRITMVVQQLMDLLGLLLLQSPGSLAGKLLGFDLNGNITTAPAISVTTAIGNTGFIVGDGVNAITAGFAGYIGPFDFDMTLEGVTLLGDAVGSIVLDLWVDTYPNFPPVLAKSIVSAAPPTIAAANKSQDLSLAGWTRIIPAGRVIGINVTSAATLKQVTVTLKYTAPALTADAASASFQTMFDALQAEFETLNTQGASSLSGNGYQTLPSGMILQWGVYTGGSSNPTVGFPIAFPTACFAVKLTAVSTAADTDDFNNTNTVRYASLQSFTAAQFSAFCSAEHGVEDVFHAHTGTSFYWLAVGK